MLMVIFTSNNNNIQDDTNFSIARICLLTEILIQLKFKCIWTWCVCYCSTVDNLYTNKILDWVNCVHSVLSQNSFAVAQSPLLSTVFNWIKISIGAIAKVPLSRAKFTLPKQRGELVRKHCPSPRDCSVGICTACALIHWAMQIWFDASSSFQWALLLTQPTAIFKASLRCSDAIWKLYGID